MATFYIRVEHEVIEYTIIEVEAESADHAMKLARENPSYQEEVDWTLDNDMGDNSFIALDDNFNPIEED